MKKILQTLAILCFSIAATGQIPMEATINVFPPYPTQYNVWLSNSANFVITVNNRSDQTYEYYLRFGLEGTAGGEETFVRISDDFFPNESRTLGPFESAVYTSADLEAFYSDATVSDLDRSDNVPLDINGQLPEGTYQLCFTVMAYDPVNEIFLSPKLCSESFNIGHNTVELVYPINESIWTETEIPTTFQWITNASQNLTSEFDYNLTIYELDPLQAANESVYELVETGVLPVFYEERGIMDFNFIYDPNFGLPPFQEGHQYAAQVEVFDTQSSFFDGGNKSNINTFWFGNNPNDDGSGNDGSDDDEQVDCASRCQPDPPVNQVAKTDLDDLQSFQMGNFTVNNVLIEGTPTGGLFSGTGEVQFDFLKNIKMSVRFSGVKVNTEDIAIVGDMQAVTIPGEESFVQSTITTLMGLAPLPENQTAQLSSLVNNAFAIQGLINGDPMPVPFGINQTIEGQSFMFTILGFDATPEGANLDFVNLMDFPAISEYAKLSIGAADVCIAPDGFGSEFKLYLAGDLLLPFSENVSMTFKGGVEAEGATYDLRENPRPCYFNFTCDGVEAINLSGNIDFGPEMIIKEEDNVVIEGENVKGYFSTLYQRDFSEVSITGNILPEPNFMISFGMDDFQFRELPGYTFKVNQASIDLSEIRNVDGMEFPENFDFDEGLEEAWQGFYLAEMEVLAPIEYKGVDRRGVIINHLLIDPTISFSGVARDLLDVENGSYKGWGIGIDTLELDILQNTFTHGKLIGDFTAPPMDETETMAFNFLIDRKTDNAGEDYYAFEGLVTPTADLKIPLAIANASVCQSSYLAFQHSKEEEGKNVELFLKGDLDINTGNLGNQLMGTASLQLADYQVHFNTVEGFKLPEDDNDWKGSYFGMDGTAGNDCYDAGELFTLQNLFDELTEQMINEGEQMYRNVEEQITENETYQSLNNTIQNQLNDYAITFDRSGLELIDGAPKLSIIVQAEISEGNPIEAGMVLTSERRENPSNTRKFNYGISDFDIFFANGGVEMKTPFDGSGLAVDENIEVSWETSIENQSLLNRLNYTIEIIEYAESDTINLDSLFRDSSYTPFYRQTGVENDEHVVDVGDLTFTLGKKYAFRIQAIDPEGSNLVNNGFSDVVVTTYGQTSVQGENAGNNSACAARCSPTLPVGSIVSPPTDLTEFTIGNFTVEIENVSDYQAVGQRINGVGVVPIDFLNGVRLRVDFTDIALNSANEAKLGTVTGRKPATSLLSDVAAYLGGSTSSAALSAVATLADEAILVGQVMTAGYVDLPFGVNLNLGTEGGSNEGSSFNANFTDFELTPTTSDVDFLIMMHFPQLSTESFGIGATDICIAPDGFGQEATFFLGNDVTIPFSNEVAIQFDGGQLLTEDLDENQPFYLKIDCDGFKELNVSGSATLPQSMVMKEDTLTGLTIDGELVNGYFSMKFTRQVGQSSYVAGPQDARTDFLLSIDMDPFQITGLDGWGFVVRNAVLDLSEAENFSEMQFPDGFSYDDIPDPELWTGFYLQELSMKTPVKFTEDQDLVNGNPVRESVTISNLLVDGTLSAQIRLDATILSYEQANIKGWGFSIEEFQLDIVQNNFLQGSLGGVLGAPVIGDDDRLPYEIIISRVNGLGDVFTQGDDTSEASFVLNAVIRPPDNVTLPLYVADANICQSSYVGLQIGKNDGDTHLELFLKGSLSANLDNSPVAIPGEFQLPMADYQIKLNTADGFIMEEDVQNGTGCSLGVGIATSDVCEGNQNIPSISEILDGIGYIQPEESIYEWYAQSNSDLAGGPNVGDIHPTIESSTEEEETANDGSMNGFPIRLVDFGLSMVNELPVADITVDIALADGSQGFAVGANLIFYARDARPNRKIKYALDRVDFGCARLAAELDAFTMVGCLCRETQDNISGYFGKVALQTSGIAMELQGGFATYQEEGALQFGTEDYYSMWYVDGTFASNNGIPLGPLQLNALGGGIYWNVAPPDLPTADNIEPNEDEGSIGSVTECIQSLLDEYGLEMPNAGLPLSMGAPRPSFGTKSIRVNAGLSLGSAQLAVMDAFVRVDWTSGEGIDMIGVGGYLYFIQKSYLARGAASPPSTSNPQNSTQTIAAQAKTKPENEDEEADGSRMWMNFFNIITFDRTGPSTKVAYEGTGSFYMNLIPNAIVGNAGGEPYRMISHDIYIGHKNHVRTQELGYDISGLGTKKTYWHAFFGNPYDDGVVNTSVSGPGSITFDLAGLLGVGGDDDDDGEEESTQGGNSLDITAYVMMGHGIPSYLPDVPEEITAILNGTNNDTTNDEDGNGGQFDGGDEVNSADSRESLADKTSGFALGAKVDLQLGFDMVIYAQLRVILGLDFMIKNVAGQTCSANGNTYSPPGIKNHYGIGQIFAGFEGALGVRGRVLGRNIDVELMYLAAAMLIEGGGPRPFWIKGQAAVRYRVLGGLIRGEANISLSAGEECSPYAADPFSLEIVDKAFPNPGHTGNNGVNPYSNVKVSFKMPVADKDRPQDALIEVPILRENGDIEVIQLAPVVETFYLKKRRNNGSYADVAGDIEYSSSGRTLYFKPHEPMAENDYATSNNRYRYYLKLRAKERDGNDWPYVGNYSSDTLVNFEATPLDPYEEYVTHTNPIRGQNYFMPGEWGAGTTAKRGEIFIYKNIRSQKFYSSKNGKACKYFIVWKQQDGLEIDRYQLLNSDIQNYSASGSLFPKMKITYPISGSLDNNKIYVLQLVRQVSHGKFVDGGLVTSNARNQITAGGPSISAEYVVQYQEDNEDPYQGVLENEELLHMLVFGTSQFNSLRDKLQTVDLDFLPMGTECINYCTAYDRIRMLPSAEPFERYDFKDYKVRFNISGQNTEWFSTAARVQLYYPMEGDFYDNNVKPDMASLLNKIHTQVDMKDVGLRYFGFVLRYDFDRYDYEYVSRNYYRPSDGYYRYAAGGVPLDNVMTGVSSQLSTPISQVPSTNRALHSFNLYKSISTPYDNRVEVGYRIREYILEDIDNIIEWSEPRLSNIKYPVAPTIQTLIPRTVATRFNSTIAAYNRIIRSRYYEGNSTQIGSGAMGYWPSFVPSDVDFTYNNNSVISTSSYVPLKTVTTKEID